MDNIEFPHLKILAALVELSPDIFGICTPMGNLIFLNQAARRLGWTLEHNVMNLFPRKSIEFYIQQLPVLRQKGSWRSEVEFHDFILNETFPVLQQAFLIRDHNGRTQAIATIATDLRSQRQLEAEIERQKAFSLQNSKMSALGEMAAGMAHEINNPLAIIKGHSSMLQMIVQDPQGPEREKMILKSAQSIEATSERIATIVRGLRNFARDGSHEPFQAVDVAKMVNGTLDFCRSRFQHNGIHLDVTLPTNPIQVSGREVQLSQALLNLLNNAFDALKGIKDGRVDLRLKRVGNLVHLSVSDSGPGIPQEIRLKVMEPFFTTKDIGEGTGLGLPISRGIIEEHGGRFYLDENAPRTTFVIELPVLPQAE